MSAGERIRRSVQVGNAADVQVFKRPNGRASFPRRVTLDLDDERYQLLQRAAYEASSPEHRSSIAEILRALVDALKADPTLLQQETETGPPSKLSTRR